MVVHECLLLLLCVGALAKPSKQPFKTSDDPLVSAFYSIPAEEHAPFLTYYLALGVAQESGAGAEVHKVISTMGHQGKEQFIVPEDLDLDPDLLHKFQEMNIPKSSTSKLVAGVIEHWTWNLENVKEIALTGETETGGKTVRTIPDLGSWCCPW